MSNIPDTWEDCPVCAGNVTWCRTCDARTIAALRARVAEQDATISLRSAESIIKARQHNDLLDAIKRSERERIAALACVAEVERERDEARDNGERFRASMYAVEEKLAQARADYLRCAQAIGVVYSADHCADVAGPIEEVERAIREAVRQEGERVEALVAFEARDSARAWAKRWKAAAKARRALARAVDAAEKAGR